MKKLTFLFLTTFAINSYAYVDPGTGAFLVQSLIALVVSVAFYLRNPAQIIKYIKEKFSKKKNDDS
jgi:hypothetical protein